MNIGEYLMDTKTKLLTPTRNSIKLTEEDVNTLLQKLNIIKLYF